MISIVFAGRNDNYGGDFEARLLDTTHYNVERLDDRGVDYEIVYVEWNPLPEKPPLAITVADNFEKARCFVVDPLVHRHLSENSKIAMMEYHAKNVGVRRSQGEMVLLMNPDNYLGTDVLDFLGREDFDTDTIYRTGWVNIHDVRDVDNGALEEGWPDAPPPFTPASGDFLLCSRDLFDRAGGYREDLRFTNTHKDSILVSTMYELTGRAVKVGNTYHRDHGRDLQAERRVQYERPEGAFPPQSAFGHDDILVSVEAAPRITWLSLRDDWQAPALKRRIPTPR